MHQALLLIGPTGSGKTPLGRMLQEKGLCGRPCVHFDFGEHLRRAAADGGRDQGLGDRDVRFIRHVLETGSLLADEQFHVAAGILRSFLAGSDPAGKALVVLNGLPRHAGQAADVDAVASVQRVVHLACTPETILQRIGGYTGGDRAGRMDDEPEAVGDRLAIFAARTAPLVDHYRLNGVEVETLQVGPATTAAELWADLNGRA